MRTLKRQPIETGNHDRAMTEELCIDYDPREYKCMKFHAFWPAARGAQADLGAIQTFVVVDTVRVTWDPRYRQPASLQRSMANSIPSIPCGGLVDSMDLLERDGGVAERDGSGVGEAGGVDHRAVVSTDDDELAHLSDGGVELSESLVSEVDGDGRDRGGDARDDSRRGGRGGGSDPGGRRGLNR